MAHKTSRLKILRDHITAENAHQVKELLDGMTKDCLNDLVVFPKPFVGRKAVAQRYRALWTGFPDFKVRIRRVIVVSDKCVVTENVWTGTHQGNFAGIPPTGKRVKVRTSVVWEFKGDKLRGEYIYYDMATILRQLGVLKLSLNH